MSKSIVKKEENLPAKPQTPLGLEEGVLENEQLIPRLKIIQLLKHTKDYPGTQLGDLVDTATKEKVESNIFIPIFKYTEWVKFQPKDNTEPGWEEGYKTNQLIWRSRDINDPRVQAEGLWKSDGLKPIATQTINFLSLFPELGYPMLVSFANTSFATGKQLLNFCRISKPAIFSRKYEIGVKAKEYDNMVYVYTVRSLGNVTDDEYALSKMFFDSYNPSNINVVEENEEESRTF